MQTVSLFDAKTHLSRPVDEIVNSRYGKPVARLLPIPADATRHIGIAGGVFDIPEDIDEHNARGRQRLPGQRLSMQLLLDTQIALWALTRSKRQSKTAGYLIEEPTNEASSPLLMRRPSALPTRCRASEKIGCGRMPAAGPCEPKKPAGRSFPRNCRRTCAP